MKFFSYEFKFHTDKSYKILPNYANCEFLSAVFNDNLMS